MADASGPPLASRTGRSFSLRFLPGRLDRPMVWFWHETDISAREQMSAFEGKADITQAQADVC
jgi:hypothetical protein